MDCFLTGECTGKKLTAEKVASMMRNNVDEHGNKMFTCEEYLTKDQVLCQFSQICAKKKRCKKLELAEVVNESSEEPENEEEDTDELQVRRNLYCRFLPHLYYIV